MVQTILKAILVSMIGLSISNANTSQRPDFGTSIEKLDVLKTCKSAAQKHSAELALTSLFNFKWWHTKNMVDSLHPEYRGWHASRVFQAVVTPETERSALAFRDGLSSKDTFLLDLAMTAYTIDASKYNIENKRLECVGDDAVVVSTVLNAVYVLRDEKGYVTHEVPVHNLPNRFHMVMKDGKRYLSFIDLDDRATVDLFKKFREIKSTPPLAPNENTRTTYQEIYARFKREAAGE